MSGKVIPCAHFDWGEKQEMNSDYGTIN